MNSSLRGFFVYQPYGIDIGGVIGGVQPPTWARFDNSSTDPAIHELAPSCTSNSLVLSHDDCWSLCWDGHDFGWILGSSQRGHEDKGIDWQPRSKFKLLLSWVRKS